MVCVDAVRGDEITLENLRNLFLGETIWVLGSGPTAGLISDDFWIGKLVVAVNQAGERHDLYRKYRCGVFTHSHYHAADVLPLARKYPYHYFVAPEGEQGFAGEPAERLPNVIYYPHFSTQWDFEPRAKENGLVVGSTSLHGAMHLAAWMGARAVIMVGADCGKLDGQVNESGYLSGNLSGDDPMPFLERWDQHLRLMADWLREEYGVLVYSLNPFVNLNLEGHMWEGPCR